MSVGISYTEYYLNNAVFGMSAYTATSGTLSVVCGRISFTLGLKGPSISIDTACSSSLVCFETRLFTMKDLSRSVTILCVDWMDRILIYLVFKLFIYGKDFSTLVPNIQIDCLYYCYAEASLRLQALMYMDQC